MENIETLKKKLHKAGKLEKLSIYGKIINQNLKEKNPDTTDLYKKPLAIFSEYQRFDPNPSNQICNQLLKIFEDTFHAMRDFDGIKYLQEAYMEFVKKECLFSDRVSLALVYGDLNYLFWRIHDLNKALHCGLKSLKYIDGLDQHDILHGRYSNIGYIYECLGDYVNAEKYHEMSVNYGMQIKSDEVLRLSFSGYGRINLAIGNNKAAANYFQEALKYFENIDGDYLAIYNNLGTAYAKMGMFKESLEYFTKYLNQKTKQKNPDMYDSFLTNAATAYMNLKQYKKAETQFKLALEFEESHNNKLALAGTLINLGLLEKKRKNWNQALEYFNQSLKLAKKIDNKKQILLIKQSLGHLYHQIGRTEEAIELFERIIELTQNTKMYDFLEKSYINLSKIYEDEKEYEKSLYNYKKFYEIKDKINSEKVELDMKLIKQKYRQQAQNIAGSNIVSSNSLISRELSKIIKSQLIGTSAKIKNVVNYAFIAAELNESPVLITGQSGTGKEIIAKIIHHYSQRKKAPFLSVNSAAFSQSLIESAFFGYEKGAFTGAHESKKGYFEEAEGGTLFFDEIGDMPLSMQAKFLRVIEERVLNRLGSTKDISLNFRLISATNKDLHEMSEDNLFRFDLFNRINTIEIHIPPLRDRLDDLPLLVDYFISIFCDRFDLEKPIFTKESIEALAKYDFPGNIRELKHILERTLLFAKKTIIKPADIIFPFNGVKKKKSINLPSLNLSEIEEFAIRKAMIQADNVQAKAAKILGISPYSLSRRLKKMR